MASSDIEDEIFPPNRFKLIMLLLRSKHSATRGEGVTSLQKFLVAERANFAIKERYDLFQESYIHLFNLMRDPSEDVRWKSIECVKYFYNDFLTKHGYYLMHLLPILAERIGIGDKIEQTEDERCALLRFLEEVLVAFGTDNMRHFAGDIIQIVTAALNGQCEEIINICLNIINSLAMICPNEMNEKGSILIQPLLATLRHESDYLRVAAIYSITEVALVTASEHLEIIADALRASVDDTEAEVRKMLALFVGRWFVSHPDRYSYCHLFLPFLLILLTDESVDTWVEARDMWLLVGEKYYEENEGKVKDEYKRYPPNVKRPSIGCRKIVQRYISLMVQPIYDELLCNVTMTRISCTKLLKQLVRHVGEDIVHYLPKIFVGMVSALHGNETVRMFTNQSVDLIGFFVAPEEWWPLILSSLNENCDYSFLEILARLIKSCPGRMSTDVLFGIASTLAASEICETPTLAKQYEIIRCVKELLSRYYSYMDARKFSEIIFNIIVSVASINDSKHPDTLELLDNLKRVVHIEDLWDVHSEQLFRRINKDPKTWQKDSAGCCIFYKILTVSKKLLIKHFAKIEIILLGALDAEVPYSCRLKTFLALEIALDLSRSGFRHADEVRKQFMPKLISECLAPALMQKQDGEQLRTTAARCLDIVLHQGLFRDIFETDQQMFEIFRTLMPIMVSLLTSIGFETRKLAIANISHMKNKLVEKNNWTTTDLIQVYPGIFKLLNDRVSEVAWYAIYTIKYLFRDIPATFREPLYKAHHASIVDSLIVHLENQNESWRLFILDFMYEFMKVNSKMVYRKAKNQMEICHSIHSKEACDELIQHIRKCKRETLRRKCVWYV